MNKIKPLLIFCCFAFYLCSCKTAVPTRLGIRWNQSPIPAEVDYSKEANWAALPTKKDLADSIPKGAPFIDEQNSAAADVFFIHPTILTYAPTNEYQWNGSVEDSFLNKKVDELTILNQASIFNGAGRIYAPRYRQAHYFAFVTSFKEDKDAALGIAYQDVKKAFDYYLAHYNQNRPIIIASHSQGTVHATQLIY